MIIHAIWHALTTAFAMGWEILWPLILGFGLSGAIQAVVSHKQMSKLLPDDKPKTLVKASLLGAASSSCSYASVALARSIFKKGGNFTAGITATSHFFVMDWVSIWTDIVLGLLIAGALAAWVPQHVWQAIFFVKHPLLADVWGPLIGPLIAVVSFVCSIGNVPLAAVLWNGGISFGGVISFIFADLIIIPIVRIYAKYYGWKMAGFLFLTFYAAMAGAGYVVEALFALLHLTPHFRNAKVLDAVVSWNYTSILNIIFLLIAAGLVWRFLRTGGPMMLKMMNMKPEEMKHHTMP
jgi:uncharacterized membrane protein YraQ (UPF0718 family)